MSASIPSTLSNILPSKETPWKLSPGLSQRVDQAVANNFSLKTSAVLKSDPEFDFIQQYFFHSKPPGYAIRQITCIHNPSRIDSFESGLVNLGQDAQNSVFIPKGDQEEPKQARKEALDRWKAQADLFPNLQVGKTGQQTRLKDAYVIPLWHGTSSSVCQSVANTGFTFFGKHHYFFNQTGVAAPSSTDEGYFGSGIYFTNSAEYAAKYGSSHLVLAFISMRKPFPVVSDVAHPQKCTDMKKLMGRGAYQNYSAHFIPVASIAPTNPNCLTYYPCADKQTPAWDEFVVFQNNHTLARFWIELTVDAPGAVLPDQEEAFLKASQMTNKQEAFLALKAVAEKGHTAAQMAMAERFMKGEGVPLDEQAAVHWYREASKNSSEGKFQLGVCYHKGKGVPQDYLVSMAYLSQAAKGGSMAAKKFIEEAFYTDLWMASQLGELDYLRQKIQALSSRNPLSSDLKKAVNALNKEGKAPLHLAAFHKQTEVALLLLASKANPNLLDTQGYQPIHWAAKGGALLILKALLKEGTNIDATGSYGRTPLHMGVFNGQEHIVEYLLKKGCNVNAQTSSEDMSKTSLHDAVIHLDEQMVRLLVSSEMLDVNILDAQNHASLYHAVCDGHLEIIKLIQSHRSFRYPNNPNDPNHLSQLVKLQPRHRADEVIGYLKKFLS